MRTTTKNTRKSLGKNQDKRFLHPEQDSYTLRSQWSLLEFTLMDFLRDYQINLNENLNKELIKTMNIFETMLFNIAQQIKETPYEQTNYNSGKTNILHN